MLDVKRGRVGGGGNRYIHVCTAATTAVLGWGERRHEKGLRNYTSIPMACKSSTECSCSIEVRDEKLEMVSTSAFVPHRGGKKKKGRTASFEPVGHCQGEPGCVYVCLLQGRFKMPSFSFISTIVHTMKA